MTDGASHNGDPGHDGDPWGELTDDVVRLAEKVKATYRQIADEDGPSEAEIRQALATLAGAWNQIARSVGVAMQDEAVRAQVRQAASSLATAVGATFAEFTPDPDTEQEP
jgi:hypothetical protein